MFNNVGRDTGHEKGMTYRKIEQNQNAGEHSATDPLGSNSEIGRKLKQYYDELISDEIPDRFSSLLSELERQESTRSSADEE